MQVRLQEPESLKMMLRVGYTVIKGSTMKPNISCKDLCCDPGFFLTSVWCNFWQEALFKVLLRGVGNHKKLYRASMHAGARGGLFGEPWLFLVGIYFKRKGRTLLYRVGLTLIGSSSSVGFTLNGSSFSRVSDGHSCGTRSMGKGGIDQMHCIMGRGGRFNFHWVNG